MTAGALAFGTRRTTVHLLGQHTGDPAFAHRILTDPVNAGPFKWRGATPSVEELADSLNEGVLASFVVSGRRTAQPIGLVMVASPDLRDGHAFISVVAASDHHGTGLVTEGAVAVVEFTFRQWPLRKLYADLDERALTQVASWLDRFCVQEGRFGDHAYRDGAWLSVYRYALYRDRWAMEMQRLRPRLQVAMPT